MARCGLFAVAAPLYVALLLAVVPLADATFIFFRREGGEGHEGGEGREGVEGGEGREGLWGRSWQTWWCGSIGQGACWSWGRPYCRCVLQTSSCEFQPEFLAL